MLLSAKEFKLKTWKTLSPTHKKASYGAMLGEMCGMYGGKGAGETLAWEEVLSFYIQFVLQKSIENKLKKCWKIDFSSFWQDLGLGGCFFLLRF